MPITNPYIATSDSGAGTDTDVGVADVERKCKSQCSVIEEAHDPAKGLHVQVHRGYQDTRRAEFWWKTIVSNARWFRVQYKSGRFGKPCETPCWTTFYGGRPDYEPYRSVPDWLRPLVEEVSRDLGVPFNAILLRLYFDGTDEIAWHTDGRTFLGNAPTIASLSFGANATFQMRRMHNVWPPLDGSVSAGDCIDRTTPQRNFCVGDGDLLVMLGATQRHWHHRVPKEKGRRPRLNINFRTILGGPEAERGQKTYYKYMVHGDNEESPKSWSYEDIMKRRGGMRIFVAKKPKPKSEYESTCSEKKGEKKRTTTAAPSEHRREAAEANACTPSKVASDVALYLAAENNVDEARFMSLPEEIRKELLSEWKSRKMVASATFSSGTTCSSKSTAGCKRSKGSNGGPGKKRSSSVRTSAASGAGTLDSYFRQKS